jgi:TRAP-type C4-dicarboxylate transport system permease small subunit
LNSYIAFMARLSTALAIVAAAMLVIGMLTIVYMIVHRSLGYASYWEIEFSIYLVVGAVFLGCPYALATNGHVSVDLLTEFLPPRAGRIASLVAAFIGLLACLYLTWIGFELTWDALLSGERSESLWRPLKWPLYATMPFGLGITLLQYVAEFMKLARGEEAAG